MNDARFVVSISPSQPFSPVNYARIAESLIQEGTKARKKHTNYAADEWRGEWTRGDEYKEYPPVIVDNPFSSIPPSSSRELMPSPEARARRTSLSHGLYQDIPKRIQELHRERERRNHMESTPAYEEREQSFRRAVRFLFF